MRPEFLKRCFSFFKGSKAQPESIAFKSSVVSAQNIERFRGQMLMVKLRGMLISSKCEFTLDVQNGLTVHDTFPNLKLDAMFFDEAGTTTMFGMKYPVDVLYLDSKFKVLVRQEYVQPAKWGDQLTAYNSVRPVQYSRFVLELPAGSLSKYNIRLGDSFELYPAASAERS